MKSFFKKLPSDRVLLAILIVLSAFAAHSFLRPGIPWTGDCWAHLARTQVVYNSLSAFQIPYWDFHIYYGYPFLKFYGPLYYYLAAFFSLLAGGNVIWGNNILLFIGHIASALAMFVLVRKLFNNSGAAFVAGLAYAFSFWHLFHIIVMNRWPAALIYVIAPLCFWAAHVNFGKLSRIWGIITGLLFGAALIIHPQYGVFVILFSLIVARPHLKAIKLMNLAWVAVAAGAISAFSIVPFIIESGKYLNPFSDEYFYKNLIWALLKWANGVNNMGHWHQGEYIGLSIIILAFVGLIAIFMDKNKSRWPLVAGLGLAAFFTFGLSIAGFDIFYKFFGMLPKRFIVFLVIFLAILAGYSFVAIKKYLKRETVAVIIISIIVLADLVPTVFQYYWHQPRETVIRERDQIYDYVTPNLFMGDLSTADTNLFEYGRILSYPGMQTLYAKNPSPFGYFYQFAPKTIYYSYPWLNILAASQAITRNDSISNLNDKIAELLNVKYLIYDDKTRGTGLGTFDLIDPILISGTIRSWPNSAATLEGQFCYADDYQRLLDSTIMDSKTATVRCLYIKGLNDIDLDGFVAGKIRVSEFGLYRNSARITVETQSPCFARIPLSYYPDIKIYINGVRCKEIYESADHFMIVRLAKGVSKIDIVPCRSNVEIASLWLSGLCLIAVNVALYRERKTRKTK
jgi:hypothetical protein